MTFYKVPNHTQCLSGAAERVWGSLQYYTYWKIQWTTTLNHDSMCNCGMLNMMSIWKRTINRMSYTTIHSLFNSLNLPRIHFWMSHHVKIGVIHFKSTFSVPAGIHMFSLDRIFICVISVNIFLKTNLFNHLFKYDLTERKLSNKTMI